MSNKRPSPKRVATAGDSLRALADSLDSLDEGLRVLRELPRQLDYLADRIADRVADKLTEELTRELYSLDRTASALSVSRRKVEKLLKDPNCQLAVVKIGTRRLIKKESILRFVEDGGGRDGLD